MRNVLLEGFADEIMKLAVADIQVDEPDPNLPWQADAESRGIKKSLERPSVVPTGHLGNIGSSSKSSGIDDGYLKGQEQTGDY